MDNFSLRKMYLLLVFYACRYVILDIYIYKYIDLTRDYISPPKEPDTMSACSNRDRRRECRSGWEMNRVDPKEDFGHVNYRCYQQNIYWVFQYLSLTLAFHAVGFFVSLRDEGPCFTKSCCKCVNSKVYCRKNVPSGVSCHAVSLMIVLKMHLIKVSVGIRVMF